MPLTATAALAVARRLWDDAGRVEHNPRALTREQKDLLPRTKENSHKRLAYRCNFGHITMGGMFFSVQGQGDTWEEAITQYDRRQDRYRRPRQQRYTATGRLKKGRLPLWEVHP